MIVKYCFNLSSYGLQFVEGNVSFSEYFLRESFVKPINLFQNPPHQGALLGMNFHSIPRLPS